MEINFEKLGSIRRSLKYTQKEVASVVGVSRHIWSRKERGLITITLLEASKVAQMFNMTIDEIFFGE